MYNGIAHHVLLEGAFYSICTLDDGTSVEPIMFQPTVIARNASHVLMYIASTLRIRLTYFTQLPLLIILMINLPLIISECRAAVRKQPQLFL